MFHFSLKINKKKFGNGEFKPKWPIISRATNEIKTNILAHTHAPNVSQNRDGPIRQRSEIDRDSGRQIEKKRRDEDYRSIKPNLCATAGGGGGAVVAVPSVVVVVFAVVVWFIVKTKRIRIYVHIITYANTTIDSCESKTSISTLTSSLSSLSSLSSSSSSSLLFHFEYIELFSVETNTSEEEKRWKWQN